MSENKSKQNQLGLSNEYLELELPSTMHDYQMWEAYKERKIIFNDDVDSNIINTIVHWIIKWNKEDEGIPAGEREIIKIYITSNGGDVISGLAAIDAVTTSVTPVHTIAVGCAASMGILLLMSGHVRSAYEHTVLLIHDGSLHVSGSSRKAKSTMGFYDKLDVRVKKYILDRTKISEEQYDEKADDEWFMFADEGLELGIIDEIIN